jgi:DNA-binding NarL/FixJ family response regulator
MSKLTYIETCPLDQFILRKVLSRYGTSCEVRCTDSCLGILSLLSSRGLNDENMPDMVVLDLYNPEINIWDFLDKIKWLYPTFPKPLEIYILSASKFSADVERARKYWFVKAFMLKPVSKEMIIDLINKKQGNSRRFPMLESIN